MNKEGILSDSYEVERKYSHCFTLRNNRIFVAWVSLGGLEVPFINGLWLTLSFLAGLLGGSDIMGFISNIFKERKERHNVYKTLLSEININQKLLQPVSEYITKVDRNIEFSEDDKLPEVLIFESRDLLWFIR